MGNFFVVENNKYTGVTLSVRGGAFSKRRVSIADESCHLNMRPFLLKTYPSIHFFAVPSMSSHSRVTPGMLYPSAHFARECSMAGGFCGSSARAPRTTAAKTVNHKLHLLKTILAYQPTGKAVLPTCNSASIVCEQMQGAARVAGSPDSSAFVKS